MTNKIAVIGGGPAGCCFACFSNENITIFEQDELLKTLLYTGGGRCNLANAIYDFKELAKNYPRGEKFLYSIFSRFSTNDTIKFFNSIGIKTYTQQDNRIFPVSNSAKNVRDALIKNLKEKNIKIKYSKISEIKKINDKFLVNNEPFDKVVIAVGGHSSYEIAKAFGHTVIEPKPALVGLITDENFNLDGVSLTNVSAKISGNKKIYKGDMIFTKNGISGPLPYIISSVYARENYSKTNPIKLQIMLSDKNILNMLNSNGKKLLKNTISELIPKSLADYICIKLHAENLKCCDVSKNLRLELEKYLTEFPITIIGHEKHGEVVTSGGISLKEIDSKTMQSKIIDGLYFCGEVIDVDGFCGGFNLQNAWSTAYIASSMI